MTLWKWLEKALAGNLLCRDGTGRKNDPYHFWLPGKLEEWLQHPMRAFLLAEKDAHRGELEYRE